MILVRDVFQLKFGQAKEAVAAWQEGVAIMKRLGGGQAPRLLTDLVGPYYTLVFEHSYPSLAEYERSSREGMANEEWRAWYPKVAALAGGGHREIFNIVG